MYEPCVEDSKWNDDSVKIVQGIGTGYGGCQLTRAPSSTPDVKGNYHVNSAEVGMTRLALYTEEDYKFDAFMKERGEKCDDS